MIAGAAGAALLVALDRPHAVAAYARDHPAFLLGAVAIAALAALLTSVATAVTAGRR
jgi:hypothetical protein